MKVTAIETLRIEEFPNLLWVQLHTDEGLTGLGETFFGPDSAEFLERISALHDELRHERHLHQDDVLAASPVFFGHIVVPTRPSPVVVFDCWIDDVGRVPVGDFPARRRHTEGAGCS